MGIESWSTTAASNNSPAPNGAPEGMAPGGVNDTIRQVMASVRAQCEDAVWFNFGHTPTYASSSTFTLSGDRTSIYQAGRRVRMYGPSMGTVYGTIISSLYSSPNTTVAVSGVGADISTVSVSIIEATNNALPNCTGVGSSGNNIPVLNASGDLEFSTLPSWKGAYVYLTANYSLADATSTPIPWTATQYDTDSFLSSTQFIVPSGVTRVRVHGNIQFASGAGDRRSATINKNGTLVTSTDVYHTSGSAGLYLSTPVMSVVAGDYFHISAYQNSGGALNVAGGSGGSWFAIEAVR